MSGRSLPAEPSAAWFGRQMAEQIIAELDALHARRHVAARLAEILVFRELGARLGPVLLKVAAGLGEDVPTPLRRRADTRAEA